MNTPKQLIEEMLSTGMKATRIAEGAQIEDSAVSKILKGTQVDLYSIPMLRLMNFHKKVMRKHAREERKYFILIRKSATE
jgi:hypothetical protein